MPPESPNMTHLEMAAAFNITEAEYQDALADMRTDIQLLTCSPSTLALAIPPSCGARITRARSIFDF
ncbi:hypothetical protein MY1884_008062 [Beauveria asiatica]